MRLIGGGGSGSLLSLPLSWRERSKGGIAWDCMGFGWAALCWVIIYTGIEA